MRTAIAAIIMAVSVVAVAKDTSAPVNFGAQPDWENFKRIAEAAIRDRLVDPRSAQFTWPYLARAGTLKAFLTARVSGYYTCGTLNSRNKMGGFAGTSSVLVMERDGLPVTIELGQDEKFDTTNMFCADSIAKGMFPPAPATLIATPALPELPVGTPRLGMSFVAVPDGLYIGAVVPNGAAAKAHISVGMVITALNGIPIKGVPYQSAVGMLRAAPSPLILTIVGVGDVKITKEP